MVDHSNNYCDCLILASLAPSGRLRYIKFLGREIIHYMPQKMKLKGCMQEGACCLVVVDSRITVHQHICTCSMISLALGSQVVHCKNGA